MTQKNVDKIKDKIVKLLAKANGTSSPEEASAFMAGVQNLLTKHQLEMGDVIKNDPMERTILFVAPKNFRPWHQAIPAIVGKYYGCKVIAVMRKDSTLMTAVGRESTRVVAEVMLPFIVDQLRKAAADYRKATMYSTRKSMDDICDAFEIRLTRLMRERDKVAADNAATGEHASDGRALMLLDEAEAAMAEMFPDMQLGKARTLTATGAAMDAAGKVSLDMQVGNKSTATLALGHG